MKYKGVTTRVDILFTLGCIILAVLNLGGLNSAGRERARRIVCAATMARFAQANHVYANNWDEQFCPPMMEDEDMPAGERIKSWLINNNFQKYMGLDGSQIETWNMVLPKEYQCPTSALFIMSRESYFGILVSYGYNVSDWDDGRAGSDYRLSCYWNDEGSSYCSCNPQPWQIGHKRTAISNASVKINFTEGNDWWIKWKNGANYVEGWDILGQALSHHTELPNYADIGMYGSTLYRHNEGANLAFYDGHVQYLPKEKVFIDIDGNPEDVDTDDATGMWYVLPP